eukprot:GILI01017870.1.p1 GENE.GILI01017870.1~~GILI01017870.1.p1  ORF type:complete len:301 (+),score=48.41 GILI01017870.1:38-940(+)
MASAGQLTEVHQDPEALIVVQTSNGDLSIVNDQLPKTLVAYDQPIVLKGSDPKADPLTDEAARLEALSVLVSPIIQSQLKGTNERPVVVAPERVLNAVLPPRTFVLHDVATGKGTLMAQPVSSRQASRDELANLLTDFERTLNETKARWTGICPVRAAISSMLFDELLRQTSIDMPERGLLLLRVRDEARMTIDALKSLHEASGEYGARKLHDTTRGKPELVDTIERLTQERDDLKKQEKALAAKMTSLERCVKEQKDADEKRYAAERQFLMSTNERLVQHIDSVKRMHEQERKALLGEA